MFEKPSISSLHLEQEYTQNPIVFSATKSHVRMAVENTKLAAEVNASRERAFDRLESMSQEEGVLWKKHACLKMMQCVETAKRTEAQVPSNMQQELEYSEKNQLLLQNIDELLKCIVKLNASQKSIRRLYEDTHQTFGFVETLGSKVENKVLELENVQEELLKLLMNLDIMRMYENFSVEQWRWQHDPSLLRVKLQLDLPASISYVQLETNVHNLVDFEADLVQVHQTTQDSLEQLGILENDSAFQRELVMSTYN
jgi:hypothetical protein